MTRTGKPNGKCWALVKSEVRAAHFSRVFSFSHFIGNTPSDVAAAISEECLSRVSEAMSYEDDPEDELEAVYLKVEKKLSRLVASTKSSGDPARIRKLNDSISVGYSSYDFRVLAAGFEQQFFSRFLSALKSDSDFAPFLEDNLDADFGSADWERSGTKEESLALEFHRLRDLRPEQMKTRRVRTFLRRVEEHVCNDMM